MTYLTTPPKTNGWNLKIPHEWGGERGNIGGEERQSQTPDASEKYNNPKTLHGALCFLRCDASMKEIFDQLWRLTMSLRYWHGGADRHWIPNPRSCRNTSRKLNWYQWRGTTLSRLGTLRKACFNSSASSTPFRSTSKAFGCSDGG